MELDVKVGDTVLVFSHWNRSREEAVVTRIGRKYIYVTQWGHERSYTRDTGSAPSGFILTRKQHADSIRRSEVQADLLTQFGVALDYTAPKYTTEQLEKLLAFMVELTA